MFLFYVICHDLRWSVKFNSDNFTSVMSDLNSLTSLNSRNNENACMCLLNELLGN